MGVNSVTLVGRAGRDPEVRYFESGSMVANLTMAVNRRSNNDEPDWFNLEIWGKQAQVAADYVRKGSLLGIIGSFKLDRWTDRATGEERTKPVIRVDRLELLGSKRDAEAAGGDRRHGIVDRRPPRHAGDKEQQHSQAGVQQIHPPQPSQDVADVAHRCELVSLREIQSLGIAGGVQRGEHADDNADAAYPLHERTPPLHDMGQLGGQCDHR